MADLPGLADHRRIIDPRRTLKDAGRSHRIDVVATHFWNIKRPARFSSHHPISSGEHPMTASRPLASLLGTAAILAALIATPATAQTRHYRHHGSGFGPAAVAGAAIGTAAAIATAPLRGGYYGGPGYGYYDDSYAYYGGPAYDDSYAYGEQPYLASRAGPGTCGPQIGATFLGADGRWYPCN
jgi:hypothetical protein